MTTGRVYSGRSILGTAMEPHLLVLYGGHNTHKNWSYESKVKLGVNMKDGKEEGSVSLKDIHVRRANTKAHYASSLIPYANEIQGATCMEGCIGQPPRDAPWVSGLVGHFVRTWPDSECSHTVQFLGSAVFRL